MNFAFSTTSCPTWDFEKIVERAGEYGYEGVEVRGFLNETILTAANIFLSDPQKVRRIFEQGGVEIACLASSIAMTGSRRRDARLADDLRTYIDTADRIGCRLVKIFDTAVRPGHSLPSAGMALGEWLLPLGDYAADRDILIVIENALSFRTAKPMWMLLDRLEHPSIACCWDVFNAAMIGERPFISVPVLNRFIQHVHVKDAKVGPLGANYCQLGDGDVPVENFIKRLRGIGYAGWVTVEWEKAWLPGLAEPEEILPGAIERLREWSGLKKEKPEEAANAEAESVAAATTSSPSA